MSNESKNRTPAQKPIRATSVVVETQATHGGATITLTSTIRQFPEEVIRAVASRRIGFK